MDADALVELARTAFTEERWRDAQRIVADVDSRLLSLESKNIPSFTHLLMMGAINELCDYFLNGPSSLPRGIRYWIEKDRLANEETPHGRL